MHLHTLRGKVSKRAEATIANFYRKIEINFEKQTQNQLKSMPLILSLVLLGVVLLGSLVYFMNVSPCLPEPQPVSIISSDKNYTIGFSTTDGKIKVIDADDQGTLPLIELPTAPVLPYDYYRHTADNTYLPNEVAQSVSSDGNKIIFTVETSLEYNFVSAGNMNSQELSSGQLEVFTNAYLYDKDANTVQFLFTSADVGSGQNYITPITHSSAFSPEGNLVAFILKSCIECDGSIWNILVYDLYSGNMKIVGDNLVDTEVRFDSFKFSGADTYQYTHEKCEQVIGGDCINPVQITEKFPKSD